MDDVTVLIGTYGDFAWHNLAAERAVPSAQALGCPVVHVHADTLHDARNQALARAHTEWVVHLDADDELEPGYLDAMATGTADLRAPAVRYIRGGVGRRIRMPRVAGHTHACTADCLPEGNWLVVGSMVRRELVERVGGWRDFEWSEDWDLWLRCWLAGASVEAIPAAIYRAHVREDSRNRAPELAFKVAVHEQIHRANFPDLYTEAVA